jgi:hypothetical protein
MSTPVECVELEVKPVVDDVEPYMTKFEQEDADIENTSNVISIPDTDPLPHNMSGDLMAMVSEVTRPMELEDLQTQMSPVIKLQVQQVIHIKDFKRFIQWGSKYRNHSKTELFRFRLSNARPLTPLNNP